MKIEAVIKNNINADLVQDPGNAEVNYVSSAHNMGFVVNSVCHQQFSVAGDIQHQRSSFVCV